MVLGRKTYEGLAAVWPQLADDPTLGLFADRMNSMPKYVASRTLREPLEWNATLLEGDLAKSVTALKDRHDKTLVSVGAGELTHALTTLGLVDELWFWVSPSLWPAGPRIFDGAGPVRLELIGSTTFGSGVVRLAHPASTRPAGRGRRLVAVLSRKRTERSSQRFAGILATRTRFRGDTSRRPAPDDAYRRPSSGRALRDA
jgi:dihydrofolate reductase